MTIRPLLLALTLLILPLSPATGQDWQTAGEAYDRGDYAQAAELFRPLAEQGHATVQYTLGYMYYAGKGDRPSAGRSPNGQPHLVGRSVCRGPFSTCT